MSHYITTHNEDGKGVFSDFPLDRHIIQIPGGTLEIISTSHIVPAEVSMDSDLKQYEHDRIHGFTPESPVCPQAGAAAAIVSLDPNAVSMMHRTMTMDALIILEGVVELHLDSGETRILNAGDSVTQRATMHQWKNVSPENGRAKMAGFMLPVMQPLVIAGKKLETDMPMGQ